MCMCMCMGCGLYTYGQSHTRAAAIVAASPHSLCTHYTAVCAHITLHGSHAPYSCTYSTVPMTACRMSVVCRVHGVLHAFSFLCLRCAHAQHLIDRSIPHT